MKLNSPKGTVSFSPSGGSGVAPVPGADKSSVAYPGVWPGVDLRYVVHASGVEEFLVLHSATQITFDFSTGPTTFAPNPTSAGLAPLAS